MTFSREAHKKRQIDEELDDIRKEITETEERNKELAGLLEFFKDKTFIEKEARERLNLKKPGENVVIIVDEGEKADSDINIEDTEELSDADKLLKEETEEPKEPSNPEKWWRYIFGKR